jgi:hypothetical protein
MSSYGMVMLRVLLFPNESLLAAGAGFSLVGRTMKAFNSSWSSSKIDRGKPVYKRIWPVSSTSNQREYLKEAIS